MKIKISEPNMLHKHWKWDVSGDEGHMKGKANSEPEAWRLAKDAEKHLLAINNYVRRQNSGRHI